MHSHVMYSGSHAFSGHHACNGKEWILRNCLSARKGVYVFQETYMKSSTLDHVTSRVRIVGALGALIILILLGLIFWLPHRSYKMGLAEGIKEGQLMIPSPAAVEPPQPPSEISRTPKR